MGVKTLKVNFPNHSKKAFYIKRKYFLCYCKGVWTGSVLMSAILLSRNARKQLAE
jgi:hypothetical protein